MSKLSIKKTTARRAAIYLRKSSDQQEASIDRQRESVNRYASTHDFTIVGEYIDAGISGLDSAETRPGFQAMLKDAKSGKFSFLIIWDLSRVSRSDPMKTSAELLPLREAGCQLVPTDRTTPIDWDDFSEQIRLTVDTGTNNQYIQKLARSTLDGQISLAREGKWVAGRPPFGMAVGDDKKLILGEPEKVKIVRWMFKAYSDGQSIRDIIAGLQKKFGLVKGTSWVSQILHNPAYGGHWVWPRTTQAKLFNYQNDVVTKVPGKQSGKVDESNQIRIRDNHVSLVPKAVYRKVESLLADNDRRKKRTTPHKHGGSFILTGLLKCKDCGSNLTGMTQPKGKVWFRCGGSLTRGTSFCHPHMVEQSEVLDAICENLKAYYLNPRVFDLALKKLEAKHKEATSVDVAALRRRLTATEKRREKAESRLVEVDSDLIDSVQTQIRKIKAEIANLKREIRDATTPKETIVAQFENQAAEVRNWIENLADSIKGIDPQKIRQQLQNAIQDVVVDVSREKAGSRYRYKFNGGEIILRNDLEMFRSW